ncbi:hypothetical protein [Streptomyces flavalbus]|uniref:Uncharacterized protein n=1 Tax=Streptomyces flavalbus TaxID=2665155 RepID=A0ABW2W8H9_9ACTN
MAEEPRVNDVRIAPDGELEFYDGTEWVPYPDLPDDVALPNGLSRDGSDGGDRA